MKTHIVHTHTHRVKFQEKNTVLQELRLKKLDCTSYLEMGEETMANKLVQNNERSLLQRRLVIPQITSLKVQSNGYVGHSEEG